MKKIAMEYSVILAKGYKEEFRMLYYNKCMFQK